MRLGSGAAPLVAVVAVAFAPSLARAQSRITVHAWEPEKATQFLPEETVEEAMGDVLAHDARLRFAPFDTLLGGEDARPQLARADADNRAADEALAQMDLDRAQALIESVLKTYQRHLPALAARPEGTRPMRDAWIKMARARFFQGNPEGASDALRYALVLDGTLTFDKELFPPQMKKLVVEARLLYETLGTGKLSIESDPPGATVWLDGEKLAPLAPTPPVDARPGPNYVSFARRGYAPTTLVFEVGGDGQEARAAQTLERYPNNPLAPIDRARAQIDEPRPPPTLKEACAQLGMDLLVLVRVERPGLARDEKPSRLVAYLYDARPDRVLQRVELPVGKELRATATELARKLVRDVPHDGTLVAATPPPRVSRTQRLRDDFVRFRRWRGFWYVVGGAAALVAGGLAVGLGVSAQQQAARQRHVSAGVVLIGGN